MGNSSPQEGERACARRLATKKPAPMDENQLQMRPQLQPIGHSIS